MDAGFSLALGLTMLVAFAIADNIGEGLIALGINERRRRRLPVREPQPVGAWLVEVARGEDGSPYSALGAVGGVAYVVIVVVLRRRA